MTYRVHRLDVESKDMQFRLEKFINTLDGDIVSIIPNYARTTLLQIYGAKSKIDFLLIIEKIKN